MKPRLHPIALGVLAVCGPAFAQTSAPAAPEPAPQVATVHLEPVEITGRHYDNAVGTSDAASQGVIRAELMKSRPALRPVRDDPSGRGLQPQRDGTAVRRRRRAIGARGHRAIHRNRN